MDWTVSLTRIDRIAECCVCFLIFFFIKLTAVIEVTWVRALISAWGVKNSGVTAPN